MFLISQTVMLIIAIAIIVLLVVIFFVTYLYNKKTPIPEGCEQTAINVQNCSACANFGCEHHIRIDELKQKIKDQENEEK